MSGSPGVGKSLLASRFHELFPLLNDHQSSEVTRIHSIAGNLKTPSMIRDTPFRSPHHSISPAGLSGGGTNPSPGEVSLAHHGILFATLQRGSRRKRQHQKGSHATFATLPS